MSDNNILKILRNEVSYFENILRRRDYFYDINQLHTYSDYNRQISPRLIKDYWAKFIQYAKNKNNPCDIDFYIHIPFCQSKCVYCSYPSQTARDRREIDRYVDYLIENMCFFSDTFSQIKFRNLYVGGGTPSILNSKQLDKVLTNLFRYFSFCGDSQKTAECNPGSTRNSRLSLLKHFGFNRVSFGVQTLNAKVLKIHKRDYQDYASIKKAIGLVKENGFRDISVDLIAGLAGDSPNGFTKSFSEIAKLRPYNIVVYGLMPPNDGYLRKYFKMSRADYFQKHYPSMISRALKIMRVLSRKFGYVADSFDPARFHWGFRHKEHLDSSFSQDYSGEYAGCTFGLGTFSRSYIHGMLEYRQVKQPRHFEFDSKIYEGRILRKKEAMIKFIINHLALESKVPQKIFEAVFGTSIFVAFPYAIYALKRLGKIKIFDDYICFYFDKPEEKYIYALFFYR
ncbi:MAG: radical SAM protein [Candidatus Omnitrophota bacterium]|nr:radical SAM protein [Candidatus Omnitrophota bacterium]